MARTLAYLTELSWHAASQVAAAAAGKPVVAVIMTGGAVDVTPLLGNAHVQSVLSVGQPSVAVQGVADVLFGASVPAGRMVQTTYPAAFVDTVSMFDMNMRPGPSPFGGACVR